MEENTQDTKFEMALGFSGNSALKLDSALRLAIPAKFKGVLDTRFSTCSSRVWVVPAQDYLEVYPEPVWQEMQAYLESLPPFDADARKMRTYKIGNAKHCTLDSQNRVQLTQSLCKLVNLKKEVVVVGQSDHMQIWDSARWNDFNKDTNASHDEVMARAGRSMVGG
jgi:MraZ protein